MSAARFVQRAPRYVYQAADGTLVRFAAMQTRGVILNAVIRDLSETGFTFTLPLTETVIPEEGTPLKVEVPIPGRSQIACFATVVRVEERNEWVPEWGDRGYHFIALQFRHLPAGHLRAIQNGLKGRVDEESLTSTSVPQAATFAFFACALAVCFFAMTLPLSSWVHFLKSMNL